MKRNRFEGLTEDERERLLKKLEERKELVRSWKEKIFTVSPDQVAQFKLNGPHKYTVNYPITPPFEEYLIQSFVCECYQGSIGTQNNFLRERKAIFFSVTLDQLDFIHNRCLEGIDENGEFHPDRVRRNLPALPALDQVDEEYEVNLQRYKRKEADMYGPTLCYEMDSRLYWPGLQEIAALANVRRYKVAGEYAIPTCCNIYCFRKEHFIFQSLEERTKVVVGNPILMGAIRAQVAAQVPAAIIAKDFYLDLDEAYKLYKKEDACKWKEQS